MIDAESGESGSKWRRRVRDRFCRFVERRPYRLANARPIVSFSFDDFPRSALTVGGAILERYGVRGTFYASAGRAGGEGLHGPHFTRDDLRVALAAGHEVACHTYNHVNVALLAEGEILDELARNQQAVASILGEYRMVNFAYPYGRVSPSAKRCVGARFLTCRGVVSGINRGMVDLALLKAHALSSHPPSLAAATRLIGDNARRGGWLILFTHEIAGSPSPYGCTPGDFERVVSLATASGAQVMPVRVALEHVGLGNGVMANAR
jgi:peptidoglycan/xylan/chitin deacetylase (PgdA/CDA1 family)